MKKLLKNLSLLCLTLLIGFMFHSVDAKAARANGTTSIEVSEYSNYPAFYVHTDGYWNVTVDSGSEFITPLNPTGTAGDAIIVLKIDQNTSPSKRYGYVRVNDGYGTVTLYITQARNEAAYKAYSNAIQSNCDLATNKTTYVTYYAKRFQLEFFSNNDIKVTDTCNNVTKTINMTKTYDSANKRYKYSGSLTFKRNGTPNEIAHDIAVTVVNSSVTKTEHYKLVQKPLILKNAKIYKTTSKGTNSEKYTIQLFTNGDAIDVWYEYGDDNNRQTTIKKRYYFLMNSTELEEGGYFTFEPFGLYSLDSSKKDLYSKKPVMCIQSYYDTTASNVQRISIPVSSNGSSLENDSQTITLDNSFSLSYGRIGGSTQYYSYYDYKFTNNHTLTVGSTVSGAFLNFYYGTENNWVLLEEYTDSDGIFPCKKMHVIKNYNNDPLTYFDNIAKATAQEKKNATFIRTYYIMKKSTFEKHFNFNLDKSTYDMNTDVFKLNGNLQEGDGKDYIKLFSFKFNSK